MSDEDGGLLKFFRGDDVVERCLRIPELREYVSDASFVKALRATHEAAEAADSPAKIAEVTRSLLADPRLTQCAMLGAGVALKVDENDMKKAERAGDIAKRSPLRVDDLVTARGVASAQEAKQRGNEAYARGDHAQAIAYWGRAIAIPRERGGSEDAATAGACYSNIAQSLLKLGHPARAEQAATRALAYFAVKPDYFDFATRPVDQAVVGKALYRRSRAREALKNYAGALSDLEEAGLDASRVQKLIDAENRQALEKRKRREEERQVEQVRGSGVKLEGNNAKVDKLGYITESDYSRYAFTALAKRVEGVVVTLDDGASLSLTRLLEQSTLSVSVTTKRGQRALYYDMDVHCAWTGEPKVEYELTASGSKLIQPRHGKKLIQGQVRLYNVSHETKYEPGADPTVAYMYQIGYSGIDAAWFDGSRATPAAPPWAASIINGAHDLYGTLATVVDDLLADLKK